MLRRIGGAYRSAFSGLPRPVWILALATLVNRSGTMVLPFLSLYLTTKLGFSVLSAGHVLSLYGLGVLVGAWLGGRLSDRVDPVLVQEASLLATGVRLPDPESASQPHRDRGDGAGTERRGRVL